MRNRRCTYKNKRRMVARKDARTFHCEERAAVRFADHYIQGRLRNWLCESHAAECKAPAVELIAKVVA